MKCINFSIQNKYDTFLKKIFENVNVKKYYWKIGFCEIINESDNLPYDTIFPSDSLDGDSFQKCINLREYNLVFADLKAFRNPDFYEIKTFEDFLNSYCEIAFFCTDSTSVEIFLKDEEVFNTIIDNCKRYKFSDLEIFTDINHGRVNFEL